MNFVTEFKKIFGNKEQKISAIEFDNKKLYDEIDYVMKIKTNFTDEDEIKFAVSYVQNLESRIQSNNEKIEELRK